MQFFIQAKPVWAEGCEREMNLTCRFEGTFSVSAHGSPILRVAAATIYRAWLNGVFLGWGPARCAHGFYRVDEWPLNDRVLPGKNTLTIEVAGYNVNCYAYLDQPSFLQAEIEENGEVLLYTGSLGNLLCFRDSGRVQKAQRFSFQRSFTEAYDFQPDAMSKREQASAAIQPEKCLLSRGIPLPVFSVVPAVALLQKGRVERSGTPKPPFMDRATMEIGPEIKGFLPEELDAFLTREVGELTFSPIRCERQIPKKEVLQPNEYALYEFAINTTGFLSLTVEVDAPCTLYLLFDERLTDQDIDYLRMGCVEIVKYSLGAGTHSLLTMEPYTLKYLKVVCLGASALLDKVEIVEYKANLPILPAPGDIDAQMKTVYDAAVETLLQNSVDLFMDCPSRERAGWLCDSYFTAKAERWITGQNPIENQFLENFLLPESFPCLPKGMFPMCYPSDHNNGNFIPNWAMWLVLEIEDNQRRTQSTDLAKRFEPKLMDLLEYFKRFENEDGLLENLEGWVFVDWSRANDEDLVSGVNYPSNMLYAEMLDAMARLYRRENLAHQANQLREAIRSQSFNGRCFVDHASRKDGKLIRGETATEACQSYAFFCGVATPERDPALWKRFRNAFQEDGLERPSRQNALIGLYVRLAALARLEAWEEVKSEIRSIFYPEAIQTGTLWEQLTDVASLNHGFASYAAVLIRGEN